MKSIAVFLCLVAATSAVFYSKVVYEEWQAFKLEHGKRYDTELEDLYRMKIYAENRRKIAKHNQKFARGLVGFSHKLNKYSDLTHHEFVTVMNGFDGKRINTTNQEEREARYRAPADWEPRKEIDWRTVGAVTEVKDQEKCASCWAFSATGALEGQHFRRQGHLVSLSEQNLIDCSRGNGNHGCSGGKMVDAFVYINENEGIDTEESYPYEAMLDNCRYNQTNIGANDFGYKVIPRNEWSLMQAVASDGPVAAAMHGSLESFRHYAQGVYYDKECYGSLRLNHAVLIVGYGRDTTDGDYWLVKNSWGGSWGTGGYAKIARNRRNLCGIASEASVPIV